jgi:hypothetical protein
MAPNQSQPTSLGASINKQDRADELLFNLAEGNFTRRNHSKLI